MTDLAKFLLARIAEDEEETGLGFDFATLDSSGWMGHAAGWGRERALAERESKRRVIDIVLDTEWERGWNREQKILAALALPYAGHPDYRDEWKP